MPRKTIRLNNFSIDNYGVKVSLLDFSCMRQEIHEFALPDDWEDLHAGIYYRNLHHFFPDLFEDGEDKDGLRYVFQTMNQELQ